METRNNKQKYLVGLAVLLGLAVISLCHTSLALASQEDPDGINMFADMLYVNPFNPGEVTSYSISSTGGMVSFAEVESDEIVAADASPQQQIYRKPPMFWTPYKPTFRSPCVPTW